MKKLSFLFSAVIFFFSFLLFPINVHAANNKVATSVKINYAVTTNGNTHVTANISLTNTTENFYVSSYAFKLGFTTVSNVQASDPTGDLSPTVKQSDSGQEITIPFRAVVYGQGKTLPFTLSFDTPDIATRNGTIWEVNIPGLANQSDFQDFTVTLTVPQSFGKPTFIKPLVPSTNLTFTKDVLGKSGISLAFGDSQTYAYSLNYHLQNNNVFPVRTEIALPPTTNYQNVSLQSLSPAPDDVVMDTDGNWLASYHLQPSQKVTITANGLVSVQLNPKQVFLSDKDRATFLKKQSYWDTDNQQIINLAKQLKTPEAIYDYVVSHLTYDFNRVKDQQVRVGSVGVLQNPTSAVCLEFTDLFVALARAAGIPAREVDGFGYTQNTVSRPLSLSKDVLHAWPEYYDDDKKTWVMVDPTWANTTGGVDYFHMLDFDHIAFVVKGASSVYPVPAGGYKFTDQTTEKDVSVSVSQEEITDEPTISMQLSVPPTQLSGFAVTGSVTLQNTGSVLFPQQPITILAQLLHPRQQFVDIGPIPPFGKLTQKFQFDKTPFLTNEQDTITIALSGKTLQQKVLIVPLNQTQIIIGGIVLVLLTTIIWIFAASARRLSIFKRTR